MANWYYYDEKGRKLGPVTNTELRQLVAYGIITPKTLLENGNGRSATAGEIRGLDFPKAPPTNESLNWFYYDTKGQKTGPMSFTVL
jgi:hypothetical protein